LGLRSLCRWDCFWYGSILLYRYEAVPFRSEAAKQRDGGRGNAGGEPPAKEAEARTADGPGGISVKRNSSRFPVWPLTG